MKHTHLLSQIINQPLLIEPSYAQVMLGALSDRLVIESLINGDKQLSATELKQAADEFEPREHKLYQVNQGVAIIPVVGTLTHKYGHLDPYSGMTGYDGIQRKLAEAINDPDIQGILLDINSPGGSVSGCFDLADLIYQARQYKPIWALVDEQACSAAYALASAANEIILPRTGMVGSIGVLLAHTDQSELLAKEGINVTLIHAGAHKADGNPFEPLPNNVKADLQSEINDIYGLFIETVSRHRQLDTEAIKNTEAKVFTGQAAIDVGLADRVLPAHQVLPTFIQTLNSSTTLRTVMTATHEPASKAEAPINLDVEKQAAVAEERQRIQAILTSDEAKGREATAQQLALNTAMSADEAIMLLKTIPQTTKANTTDFTQVMNNDTHPNIDSEAVPAAEAPKTAIGQMLADFNHVYGDKA
ncbi:S49 family peptidase [Spartinivicinus marinus]|uniref:S49 family peptidase n=1 Tax=Spartinivicinus marinus TaxID=2994442 RepID=UPI00225A5AA0|nr:S49 family peptidase [Spartinivicinus marinus]MCX4025174.1 S49 family peptidase [Spartinivicinus marinus]